MKPKTRQELLEQYGNKRFQFYSYYKYSFCFKGHGLFVSGGDNHEDIYRAEILPEMALVEIDEQLGISYWWEEK